MCKDSMTKSILCASLHQAWLACLALRKIGIGSSCAKQTEAKNPQAASGLTNQVRLDISEGTTVSDRNRQLHIQIFSLNILCCKFPYEQHCIYFPPSRRKVSGRFLQDPLADGPTIQASHTRGLETHTNLEKVSTFHLEGRDLGFFCILCPKIYVLHEGRCSEFSSQICAVYKCRIMLYRYRSS